MYNVRVHLKHAWRTTILLALSLKVCKFVQKAILNVPCQFFLLCELFEIYRTLLHLEYFQATVTSGKKKKVAPMSAVVCSVLMRITCEVRCAALSDLIRVC